MTYYLGLDAGGSTCRVRVVDAKGVIIGEGRGGPANARIGLGPLLAVLGDTIRASLGDLQPSAVKAGFGIAGLNRPGIRAALEANAFGFAALRIESDGHIACLGAHNGQDGGIVIVGTGSIALIKQGADFTSVGGHGFPISGEGSGASIGLRAVTWLYRVMDGRVPHDALFEPLLAAIGGTKEASYVWVDHAQPHDYAQLAPIVLESARQGGVAAQALMVHAALDIGDLIEATFALGAQRCSLIGGLAEPILTYLPAALATRLSQPLADPLTGALMLAKGPRR